MSVGIYKFQNLITQEVYVGQSINLEARYKRQQHEWVNKDTDFYTAIQDYGWNNFSYEVIENCSIEQLNEREIYWISYYDSYNNGYNMTKGGSNKNSVNHYEIHSLWEEGLSPKEISIKLNIGLSTTYQSLNGYLPFIEREKPKNYIYQYDLNGNYIQSWNSQKEVERELNISSASIGKVISGKRNSAGGFLWRNEYFPKIEFSGKIFQEKQIYQYDLNGNYLQSFSSIKEASEVIHGDPSLISRVARKGLSYSAYNYRWSYQKI